MNRVLKKVRINKITSIDRKTEADGEVLDLRIT